MTDTLEQSEIIRTLFGSLCPAGELKGSHIVQSINQCTTDEEAVEELGRIRKQMIAHYEGMKTVNASKENAQKALDLMGKLPPAGHDLEALNAIDFIRELLKAAQKKLPSEAAIQKDKQRSRKKKAPITALK